MKNLIAFIIGLIPLSTFAGVYCGKNINNNPVDKVCVLTIDQVPVSIILKGKQSHQKILIPIERIQSNGEASFLLLKKGDVAFSPTGDFYAVDTFNANEFVPAYFRGIVFDNYFVEAELKSAHLNQ